MSNKKAILLLGIIFSLALLVRLWGINHGLPYLYHPDEPNKVSISLRMLITGDLNPHYFNKPAFLLYINTALYKAMYSIGRVVGVYDSLEQVHLPDVLVMGVGRTDSPEFFLAGRILAAITGTISTLITFLIGKKVTGNWYVGLLAAFFVSISPTNIANSRAIEVDTFLVFSVLLTINFSVDIYQRGRLRDYLLACISAGIAISFKYPGGIVLFCILIAHILREWRSQPHKSLKLYAGLLSIPLIFILANPYMVLDFNSFLSDVLTELNHYSSGHPGYEGDTLRWYLTYFGEFEGVIVLIGFVGMVRQIWRRDHLSIILAVFILVYFSFFSSFEVRFDRTLLPILPPLFVFASAFTIYLLSSTDRIRSHKIPIPEEVWLLFVIGLLSARPLTISLQSMKQLTTEDSVKTAREWIDENIPEHSKVAIEAYSPYLDPDAYDVGVLGRMIDRPPDWFIDNNFQYLVFSEGMYGRFFLSPDLYQDEINLYKALFDQFALVEAFTKGNPDIRIYTIR